MKLFWIGLGLAALVSAQENPQRITMPFRDASAPRKLVVNLLLGSVTVKGYDGKDAVIEYQARGPLRRRTNEAPPAGMHRLGPAAGLEVTEDNNVIHVSNGSWGIGSDLTIQVPVQTSVSVKTMTGRDLSIDNISGEIEANNMNGQVTITNASGSVVAHSMNGKVVVSLNQITAGKNMSFSTMNGDVDVTLPASTKARFKLRADNGDIFTDFDVHLEDENGAPIVENNGRRVFTNRQFYGSVNGGGPEMQFTTFNGRILIHKK